MAGSLARVALYDDTEGARAPLPWLGLPPSRPAGLLISCRPGQALDGDQVPGQQFVRLGGARSGLLFRPVRPAELAREVAATARSLNVHTVVICPANASGQKTALALATGALLTRPPRPVAGTVTCPRRPRLDAGMTAVPHVVQLTTTADGPFDRVVWQILTAEQLPGWLAASRAPNTPAARLPDVRPPANNA